MRDIPEPEDLREVYVAPFYLAMMGMNATTADRALLDEVRERAREISPRNIARLLYSDWRPRVMGGWYAVAAPTAELGEVVLQSLRSSTGALTAPVLLVTTLDYVASGAVPADTAADVIDDYHRRDVVAEWGAGGLARAAAGALAGHSGIPAHLPEADAVDADAFETLRAVGRTLQG